MKTIEEIKDEVANSLIYASDWNGRITGWYHWNNYTMPSKKQYDAAYDKVAEAYASQFTSPIDTDINGNYVVFEYSYKHEALIQISLTLPTLERAKKYVEAWKKKKLHIYKFIE